MAKSQKASGIARLSFAITFATELMERALSGRPLKLIRSRAQTADIDPGDVVKGDAALSLIGAEQGP